jgi:predicted GH43/DUF377 family glycosyl hydrolase
MNVVFRDRPGNQPVNRFRGHVDVPAREPDPLPAWMSTPFEKRGAILGPIREHAWESKDVFNPTAIVRAGSVHLLYRAEDHTGPGDWNGTSRIGLAVSDDGLHFERAPTPVVEPSEPYELPGGCEDPRVVEIGGEYILTYTAYDGHTARLAIATSSDLVSWRKRGLVFPELGWTKAGAILSRPLGGRYLMYFGDRDIHLATSADAIHWEPHADPVLERRARCFDEILCEPGPPPWLDDAGIHLLYHGDAPPLGYAVGEAIFDRDDPGRVIQRSTTPLIAPTERFEIEGQVGKVIFTQGMVHFKDALFLYYGAADGQIAVAVAQPAARECPSGLTPVRGIGARATT